MRRAPAASTEEAWSHARTDRRRNAEVKPWDFNDHVLPLSADVLFSAFLQRSIQFSCSQLIGNFLASFPRSDIDIVSFSVAFGAASSTHSTFCDRLGRCQLVEAGRLSYGP